MKKPALRKFFKRAVLAGAFSTAALGVYSYEIEPNWLKTTTYDISSSHWPQQEPPLSVAVASDFHVGSPNVTLQHLPTLVDKINALKADVIVLPGDFLTMTGNDRVIGGSYVPPEEIAAALKNLKAPLGVYAVLGNHDVYNDPEGMKRALEGVGIRVLDNDSAHVKSALYDFWVAGLADDTTQKPDWNATRAKIPALAGNGENKFIAPTILIMHDPGSVLDVDGSPQFSPIVSVAGHTHGGQFLPFLDKYFGNPVTRAPVKYLYGHFSEPGRELVVTSGLGESVVPLRLGARPEIIKLKIHPS
jgi:predicted MPP superfamily phosphohydrolase